MRRKYTVTAFAILALIPAAWCQSPVPAPLSGDQGSPRFSGESEPRNVLTVNLGVSSRFDDNALNDDQNKVSNFVYRFAPQLIWDISRARWRFSVDSLTSLSHSNRVSTYGGVAENLIVNFGFNPTPRLSFRVRNNFNISTDPFDRFPSTSVPGIGDQPNQSILGPPTERKMEQVGADVTYQFGPRTNLGVSGTFSMTFYDREASLPSFVHSDTYRTSGRAFVSHQISPRHTSSLSYDLQRFTFSSGVGATTHSINYFHTVSLTPRMQVSLWAGPEYLRSSTGFPLLPVTGTWSWTGGASYQWSHNRTGITASVVRGVSDGGGLGFIVENVSTSVALRQQLSRRWVTSVSVSYNVNDSVSAFGNADTRYFSGNASLTRMITPHLQLTLDYWRARQWSSTDLGVPVPNNHNRAAISLRYSFSRPIGS